MTAMTTTARTVKNIQFTVGRSVIIVRDEDFIDEYVQAFGKTWEMPLEALSVWLKQAQEGDDQPTDIVDDIYVDMRRLSWAVVDARMSGFTKVQVLFF